MNQPLAWLLFTLRNNQCSVARDRIFSLISICSERGLVQVDYESPVSQLVYQILSVFSGTVCVCITRNILGILRLEIDPLSSNDLALMVSDGPYLEFSFTKFYFEPKFDSQDEDHCGLLKSFTHRMKPRDHIFPKQEYQLTPIAMERSSPDIFSKVDESFSLEQDAMFNWDSTATGPSAEYIYGQIDQDFSWSQDDSGNWKFRVSFVYIWNWFKLAVMNPRGDKWQTLCTRLDNGVKYSSVRLGWGNSDLHANPWLPSKMGAAK